MADLAALRELAAWMRAEGVAYARCGELELRLGPPPPQAAAELIPHASEDDDERSSLELLLHSSGVNPEPFVRALRASRAA